MVYAYEVLATFHKQSDQKNKKDIYFSTNIFLKFY